VAGRWGGRRLATPAGERTRPTSEKVRAALASSLTAAGGLEGARVLDLYAGSGALGIEALSRGAASATFLETSAAARAVIEDNLRVTGLADDATVLAGDALAHLERDERHFDLVLADPPYDFAGWPELAAAATARLAPDGLLVAESDHEPDLGGAAAVLRSKRYGGTVVVFARRLMDP